MNEQQLERYSRNIVLAEIGPGGQRRLCESSVLVVGAGGLGSPAALYLAAAGVGRLGIVDSDRLELSNLQRQILHSTRNLGEPKAASAARTLGALNPEVLVEPIEARLGAGNIAGIIGGYDFIVDGSDNFATKFLVNDACHLGGKPLSHAGVLGFRGQAVTVVPGERSSACLRCILPELPPAEETPTCASSGVLGAAAGLLGSVQAAEAIKYLAGAGELLTGRLLLVDTLAMSFRICATPRDSHCPLCSPGAAIRSLDPALYETSHH